MILHTVNKSPYSHHALKECLRLCQHQASILFIEDGVIAATDSAYCEQLLSGKPQLRFYALLADIMARGLSESINPSVTVIDDDGFVELVTQHHSVQSWF